MIVNTTTEFFIDLKELEDSIYWKYLIDIITKNYLFNIHASNSIFVTIKASAASYQEIVVELRKRSKVYTIMKNLQVP